MAITQQDDIFDSTKVAILHDLLKILPSFETNYKDFNTKELGIWSGNCKISGWDRGLDKI